MLAGAWDVALTTMAAVGIGAMGGTLVVVCGAEVVTAWERWTRRRR